MLWDAGFDQNNIINGVPYSENIVKLMNNGGVPPNPSGSPQTLPPVTPGAGTKPPVTQNPPVITTKDPVPPTKPCKYFYRFYFDPMKRDNLCE